MVFLEDINDYSYVFTKGITCPKNLIKSRVQLIESAGWRTKISTTFKWLSWVEFWHKSRSPFHYKFASRILHCLVFILFFDTQQSNLQSNLLFCIGFLLLKSVYKKPYIIPIFYFICCKLRIDSIAEVFIIIKSAYAYMKYRHFSKMHRC